MENYSQNDRYTTSLCSVEQLRASIMNREGMNIHEAEFDKLIWNWRKNSLAGAEKTWVHFACFPKNKKTKKRNLRLVHREEKSRMLGRVQWRSFKAWLAGISSRFKSSADSMDVGCQVFGQHGQGQKWVISRNIQSFFSLCTQNKTALQHQPSLTKWLLFLLTIYAIF